TQPPPDIAATTEIKRRGTKRSTRYACIGEHQVCRMISSENVHCNSASVVPSFWLSGPVNSVHTYCGLEIAIMATRPRMSWLHRFQYHAGAAASLAADMVPP